MKIFRCESCAQVVYFENTQCTNCGSVPGFLPERFQLGALAAAGDGRWRSLADNSNGPLYRMCLNYAGEQVCNWMVPEKSQAEYCSASCLNRIIPNLGVTGNRTLWGRLEAAKHRLIYSLLRFGLPLISKQENPVSRRHHRAA
jgi:hypothetical protein